MMTCVVPTLVRLSVFETGDPEIFQTILDVRSGRTSQMFSVNKYVFFHFISISVTSVTLVLRRPVDPI